jgi:hypothetical protein
MDAWKYLWVIERAFAGGSGRIDFDGMRAAVVNEPDDGVGLFLAVEQHANRRRKGRIGPHDMDMVEGVAEAVVQLERWPGLRQLRIQPQLLRFELHAEQVSTSRRYIQPAAPVYQVQPPRPVCGAVPYTSAATT